MTRTTKQARLFGSLRQSILDGRYARGDRLPSSRELASELGYSRNTVLAVYEQLIAEGYIETKVGAGTYVTAELPERFTTTSSKPEPRRPSNPSGNDSPLSRFGKFADALSVPLPRAGVEIDFRYGVADVDSQLRQSWRAALAHGARSRLPALDDYAASIGEPNLRQLIAQYVFRSRGVRTTTEQVIIVNGSQQALDLIARVLIDPGEIVVLEDPCYLGARYCFAAHGAQIIGQRVDGEGMTLPQSGARLAYVTPSHQFPTGVVMSITRRMELLQWAHRNDALVIEDDYDGEFRYVGNSVGAIQGLDDRERVIYVGTFSKVMFPALRLGYLVVPRQMADVFARAKWLTDRHSPLPTQLALGHLLETGEFQRLLRRNRHKYAQQRERLLAALTAHMPPQSYTLQGDAAGIHVLCWLDRPATDAPEIAARASEAGVGVYPATSFFMRPPDNASLLLGFAAVEPDAIDDGIARLAGVLETMP